MCVYGKSMMKFNENFNGGVRKPFIASKEILYFMRY